MFVWCERVSEVLAEVLSSVWKLPLESGLLMGSSSRAATKMEQIVYVCFGFFCPQNTHFGPFFYSYIDFRFRETIPRFGLGLGE